MVPAYGNYGLGHSYNTLEVSTWEPSLPASPLYLKVAEFTQNDPEAPTNAR